MKWQKYQHLMQCCYSNTEKSWLLRNDLNQEDGLVLIFFFIYLLLYYFINNFHKEDFNRDLFLSFTDLMIFYGIIWFQIVNDLKCFLETLRGKHQGLRLISVYPFHINPLCTVTYNWVTVLFSDVCLWSVLLTIHEEPKIDSDTNDDYSNNTSSFRFYKF